MSKKQNWSKKEDETLLRLIQQQKITKWVDIASLLSNESGLSNRTGKQCRDRYVNKLAKNLIQKEWQSEEDRLLIQLLRQYGRKWTLISLKLQGRGENSIKNRYYSKMRKSLRELNKIISCYFSSQYTALDSNFLNKLISISSQKFKDSSKWSEEQLGKAISVIEQLFWGVQEESLERNNLSNIRKLLDDCLEFGETKKKTTKKDSLSQSVISQRIQQKMMTFKPQVFCFVQQFYCLGYPQF